MSRLVAALLILTGLLHGPEVYAQDKLKVLLLDGQNNHNWQQTSPLLIKILESTGRFAVERATSPPKGEDLSNFQPRFADYDVVVSNYNGDLWSAATREALYRYVKGGGGFVVVHAANNAFPEWPEYNLLIGLGGWGGRNEKSGPYVRFRDGKMVLDTSEGRGGSHGARHEFVVRTFDNSHAIMRGLPPEWLHQADELYDRLRGPARNLSVLATAYSDPATNGSGEVEPLLMTLEHGNGRVFHTALGHDLTAMSCVGFQVTLQRGTEWAATGKVTLTQVPPNFPTPEKTASRAFE
ncbi:MAG: ThuA domain-containing protein [Planctomycetaceae bacterium]|nr:ThuA domain-containing protein [Planctomycetaceae bacterium]